MLASRRDHLLDRPATIERDQDVAQRVASRVQADRQRELGPEGGEPADARDHARGGHRDVAGPEPEPPAVVERGDRLQHPVEVEEGLAHPHVHDVGQPLAVRREHAGRVADLVDDLGGREVAIEAELPGGAERAADGAAALRADAQRVPFARVASGRVVHEDGLDQEAVGEPVEHLLGEPAVGLPDLALDRGVEPERLGELVPQRGRERQDLRERGLPALPGGVEHLARPVGGLAPLDEPGCERLGRDAADPGPGVTVECGGRAWRRAARRAHGGKVGHRPGF